MMKSNSETELITLWMKHKTILEIVQWTLQ